MDVDERIEESIKDYTLLERVVHLDYSEWTFRRLW